MRAQATRSAVVGTSTGALPACAGDYWPGPEADYSALASGVIRDTSINGTIISALSDADCLWQNNKPSDSYDWFRAIDGRFVPSEVSASTTTQHMSLQIVPVGFNTVDSFANWGCAPQTSFPGGCTETWRSDILYREANAVGVFDGVWNSGTLNPYFTVSYAACGGGPDSGQVSSLPCAVDVTMATDAQGKVVLQKNLQVLISISVDATRLLFGVPDYAVGQEVPVSFMIRAGGGLAITAASTPRTVAYGTKATVTARVDGVPKGSDVALDAGPTDGDGPWTRIATASTDSKGHVSFSVTPKATKRYRARLLDAPAGSTVSDDAGVVKVASTIRVTAGRVASGHVPVDVVVKPGSVTVTVQRRSADGWVDVVTHDVGKKGTATISVPVRRGTTTLRVVVPKRSGQLGVTSRTMTVVR